MESATEKIPPGAGSVRVKWCGKSAPRGWQQTVAGQTPPGARPNRGMSGFGCTAGTERIPG